MLKLSEQPANELKIKNKNMEEPDFMIRFKEITAKELCDGYNKCATDNLKDKFFRDNFKLRTEYIPYTEKIGIAEAIMKTCCHLKDENGEDSYYVKVSSPFKYLSTVRQIVIRYTNIIFNDPANKSFIAEYDMLMSCGLLDKVLSSIPQRELQEFNSICNMVYDDIMTNYYEPHGFITNNLARITSVLNNTSTPFFNSLSKKVSNMDDKTFQKIISSLKNKVTK